MSTETLPPFPVDDATLALLVEALNTSYGEPGEDGNPTLVGGEFTLSRLLDFLSGYDPAKLQLVDGDPAAENPSGMFGIGPDTPIYVYPDVAYHPNDVIRALVAEVRRLRDAEAVQ